MKNASLDSLPDVLSARDVAAILNIGYVKALGLIRFGGMNYIQVGRVYRISKTNFVQWLNCTKPIKININ